MEHILENECQGNKNGVFIYRIPLFMVSPEGSSTNTRLLRLSGKYIIKNDTRIDLNPGVKDLDWDAMRVMYQRDPNLRMQYAYLHYKDTIIYSVYS